jgi:HEAT repeat protein
MIQSDILKIISDEGDDGSRLNAIVDEFRGGRDIMQIVNLLDSDNPEVVSIGAWILSELHYQLYNSCVFINRLKELLDHEDPGVRFAALSAIYPAINPLDENMTRLLNKLRNDQDEGVRLSAEAICVRIINPRP